MVGGTTVAVCSLLLAVLAATLTAAAPGQYASGQAPRALTEHGTGISDVAKVSACGVHPSEQQQHDHRLQQGPPPGFWGWLHEGVQAEPGWVFMQLQFQLASYGCSQQAKTALIGHISCSCTPYR